MSKKSWDKKYYKEIKTFMDNQLWHVDYRLAEKYKDNPAGWAQSHFNLITDCVHREDYEAAQATKDAIIEFLNKLGAEIPNDAALNIPDYAPMEIHGIICLGKSDDPTGMGSGGAIWL